MNQEYHNHNNYHIPQDFNISSIPENIRWKVTNIRRGPHIIINTPYIEFPLFYKGQKLSVLISPEDEYLTKYNWCYRSGYVIEVKTMKRIDSFIIKENFDSTIYAVDHINRNKLDNRRDNLELVTHEMNNLNSLPHKDSTSIYKGVCFLTDRKKYQAKFNNINLKNYDTEIDAAKIVDKQAVYMFGMSVYTNFQYTFQELLDMIKGPPPSENKVIKKTNNIDNIPKGITYSDRTGNYNVVKTFNKKTFRKTFTTLNEAITYLNNLIKDNEKQIIQSTSTPTINENNIYYIQIKDKQLYVDENDWQDILSKNIKLNDKGYPYFKNYETKKDILLNEYLYTKHNGEIKTNLVIDHINNNILDVRLSNLCIINTSNTYSNLNEEKEYPIYTNIRRNPFIVNNDPYIEYKYIMNCNKEITILLSPEDYDIVNNNRYRIINKENNLYFKIKRESIPIHLFVKKNQYGNQYIEPENYILDFINQNEYDFRRSNIDFCPILMKKYNSTSNIVYKNNKYITLNKEFKTEQEAKDYFDRESIKKFGMGSFTFKSYSDDQLKQMIEQNIEDEITEEDAKFIRKTAKDVYQVCLYFNNKKIIKMFNTIDEARIFKDEEIKKYKEVLKIPKDENGNVYLSCRNPSGDSINILIDEKVWDHICLYSWRNNNGKICCNMNGQQIQLNRYLYSIYKGEIKYGYNVIFVNKNKYDFRLENLEQIPHKEVLKK